MRNSSSDEQLPKKDGPRSVGLVIWGICYSMKNSKRPRRNAPGMVKNPKALAFERDFALQVRPEHRLQLGRKQRPLRATVRVFYPSRKQDLDVELVFDCLQKNGVILNDRYIRVKLLAGFVDVKNPRVEILIEEMDPALLEQDPIKQDKLFMRNE